MPRVHFHPRRLRWLVLLAAVLSLPLRASAGKDSEPPEIKDALRDGAGRVWGIASGRRSGLYVLDEHDQWQDAAPPGLEKAVQPCGLGRRADGTVVCVWRVDHARYQWSAHHGQDSRAGASFPLEERRYGHDLRLTGDSKGNLWLTQEGPAIYRLAPDGTVECAHTISEQECLAGSYASSDPASVWGAVCVCEDAGGRLWFWTDHADGASNGATLRGALVYDGGKFVQHDFLLPGGQKQEPLTVLASKDAQHLWFARMFGGLYTLDTATFQAERVPDQPKEAGMTSLAVRDDQGVWYFVLGQARPEGGCSFWRLTGGNHWDKIIDPVDEGYDFKHQQDRVWSPSEQGGFLGTNGNGMWFLPSDGSLPVHADWRQGFPLATPHRFLDLQNGRWLGVSTEGLTWVGAPAALVARVGAPDDGRIRILRPGYRLRVDVRGHLWSTFTFNSRVLHEWDGERWTEHPFPPELGGESIMRVLNLDARGRVWLRTTAQSGRTAIYDPRADRWQVFDHFERALEAQDGHADAEFPAATGRYDLPRFGPQGRVCYLAEQWKVMVYADHAWREWSLAEITGQTRHFAFEGAPFFNRAGRVSINAGRQTWELLEGGVWRTTTFERGFADNDVILPHTLRKAPADARLAFEPDSSARDNQDGWWLTWRHGLFRFREGLCVPVLAAGDRQPFTDGRKLGEVCIDARGNTFLRENNREEYVVLAPPGPAPRTTLSEVAAAGSPAEANDRRTVRLKTDAAAVEGKVRFSWRLDGGAWTALAADGPEATVTLEALPGGAHRFEARSFDAALQTDPEPARLPFEVQIDPRTQIDGFIARLADPDYSRRKEAVDALARQPDLAFPALQTARGNAADESQRWWIDAALQQVEAARRSASDKSRTP